MSKVATESVMGMIKEVLEEITRNESVRDMDENTRLREDLGIDSLTSLTFLMAVEDKIPGFVVDAATLDARHFQNIGTICEYVLDQLARAKVA